jgi:hypothetical protein
VPYCGLVARTRALGGNSLSWVYSVEWPVFALIAIAGLPAQGRVVCLAHASLGLLLALASLSLVVRVRGTSRMSHVVAWLGLTGVSVAGVGGLLTAETSLVRFLGLALMFTGAVMAVVGYRVPTLIGRSRPAASGTVAEVFEHG